jgi:hypothetical protein
MMFSILDNYTTGNDKVNGQNIKSRNYFGDKKS